MRYLERPHATENAPTALSAAMQTRHVPGWAGLTRFEDEGEIGLMRKLAQYPRVVASAAHAHEPHRIAFYLYELASEFHGFWARGKVAPHLRVIQEADRELTTDRFALIAALSATLKSGLTILGVSAPLEMR